MKRTAFLLPPALILAFLLTITTYTEAQTWALIQGVKGQDVAVGNDGSVWATGSAGEIFRYNGKTWDRMPGGASMIAVDPQGDAWVVNSGGGIFKYNTGKKNWDQIPGAAKDIGIGADGSVWVIGTGATPGGYEIFKWNGKGWTKVPGGAVRIAVDPSGNAWVVNNTNNVFAYNGTTFVMKTGSVADIGIGGNGSVWCTGKDDKIYKWEGNNWKQQSGGATRISVGPDGTAWVVNKGGQVYKTHGGSPGVAVKPEKGNPNKGPNKSDRDDNKGKGKQGGNTPTQPGTAFNTPTQTSPTTTTPTSTSTPTSSSTTTAPAGSTPTTTAPATTVTPTAPTTTATPTAPTSTTSAPTTTSSTTSTTKPAVDVVFDNIGFTAVTIHRSSPTALGEYVTEISPQSQVSIPVRLGDQFEVLIDEKRGLHPKIYIVDTRAPVLVLGNIPMKDNTTFVATFDNRLDYIPNMAGVDATKLNYRNLVSTINKKPIFQKLDQVNGVDYDIQAGKVMKFGFSYAGTNLSMGENKSHMSYGYSSFSENWNIALSGKAPVGKTGVDVAGEFGYGETTSIETSSLNVYAYTRQQTSIYTVEVDPFKAALNPEFKHAVLSVTSPADAKTKIIDVFGTHYPVMVDYGGDRSAFMMLSSEQYAKANTMNMNIKAELTKSTAATKKETSGNTTTTSQTGGDYGGSLAFGYGKSTAEGSLLETTKSQYRMIGGTGGFGDWSVSQDNAAPIAVQIKEIYELIQPRVFKDGTDPTKLAIAKMYIKTAVDAYLKAHQKTVGSLVKAPAPKVYEIKLTKMEVMEEVDDANKNTKGHVNVAAYDDKKVQVKNMSKNLWQQDGYSTGFEFRKGRTAFPNTKATFTQFAVGSTFKPFYIKLGGEIIEKDDLWDIGRGDWDYGAMRGNTDFIDLNAMNLDPMTPVTKTFDVSFRYTAANLGKVRLTYTITLLPNEFSDPLF